MRRFGRCEDRGSRRHRVTVGVLAAKSPVFKFNGSHAECEPAVGQRCRQFSQAFCLRFSIEIYALRDLPHLLPHPLVSFVGRRLSLQERRQPIIWR